MKILVIFVFIIYLLIGIWGCTEVKEGLDRRKLSRDDSYSVKFYDFEDRFFREYPYRIQLVVNKTFNYADQDVRDHVESIIERFERSRFINNHNLTESWLRAYMRFIEQEDSFLFLQALNMSDPYDFYTGLRTIFLRLPGTESFRNDVVFNEDGSEIIAARFVIQTINITDANMEKEMLIEMRSIADDFKNDQVTIFNHLFIFFDQFILVRSISLQTIGVAAVVMMAISLLFIPSPSCAIWVAFSIISIEIGVVGYMTHWGVNLDSISMINLIMCIGFSVDFSAHISYAYISSEEDTPAERVRSALYSLGLPIFQGSVSTILGIVALAFAPSYVFLTFFKTVFLVMLFGATHGVLLLPVLLSMTDFNGPRKPKVDKDGKRTGRKQSNIISSINQNYFDHDKGALSLNRGHGAIFIPRPTFAITGPGDKDAKGWVAPDADSGQGSKSSASSDTSCVPQEKDLGLGTSGEEYSEGSWKESDRSSGQIRSKESSKGSSKPESKKSKKSGKADSHLQVPGAIVRQPCGRDQAGPNALYRQSLYQKWPHVNGKINRAYQEEEPMPLHPNHQFAESFTISGGPAFGQLQFAGSAQADLIRRHSERFTVNSTRRLSAYGHGNEELVDEWEDLRSPVKRN